MRDAVLIAAVLALLLNARRLARFEGTLGRVHPGVVALVLAVLALAARTFYFVKHAEDLTFDHMVMGAPFSDSADWHAMARDFALGQRHDSAWVGWSARRPLYYLFMGSVFAVTGASVAAAQWTHFLLSTISVLLVFDLMRRSGPMLIAVAVAGFFAFDRWDIRMNLSTMTETLGTFGTVVSLWLLVVAVDRTLRRDPGVVDAQRSRDITMLWALSGVSLALANLARPLTLPLAATLALVPFVLCARNRPRCRWSTPARLVGIYGLAVALTLAPWIIRQYVRHGITALSENGGEALYAATSPEHGTWSPKVSGLAGHTQSMRERVDFYKEGIRDNLRRHPGFYLTNSIHHARDNLRALAISSTALVCLLLLTFVVVLARLRLERHGVRWGPAIAILAGLLSLSATESWWAQLALLLLALGLGAARSPALLVMALFTVTYIPLLGMLALPAGGTTRFNYGLRGFFVATVWWSAWELFSVATRTPASGRRGPWRLQPAPARRTWGRAPIPLGIAAACLALLVVGLATAVLRYTMNPEATARLTERVEDPGGYRRALLALPGYESLRPWTDRMEVYRTRLIEDYFYRFDVDDRISHWYEGFSERPYPFTVIRLADGANYVCSAGTTIDSRLLRSAKDAIMIGLEVPTDSGSHQPIFEVLAFALPGEPPEILAPAADLLAMHTAHLQQRLPGGTSASAILGAQ